ncbi:MAG: helix-turn-helix domain-containing protein, partial [Tetragenococcus halophilus]|nr:helix-turn-helix domain-containing protein [Tetragenococcus halophilus]
MNIGERMKERRKQLKITADQVAEKIGVSRSNVYRYEKGDIEKLPIEVLEPLSEILRTTPQYLMGWETNEDILTVYNELEKPRKKKVYNY